MAERLLIAAGIAALLGLVRFAFAAYGDLRLQRTADGLDRDLLAKLDIVGQPAVVYFWTETCGQCQAMQAPALDRLADTVPTVQVVPVNAVDHPDLADRFGVMTVPTTAVVDEAGHLRAVNHGYADEGMLKEQLIR